MTRFKKKINYVTAAFCYLLCLVIFLATLFIISPGRLKPFLDQDGRLLAGSISEKIFIKIGGVEQGMFIRGKDLKNPVLLFVHGGPSFRSIFWLKNILSGWRIISRSVTGNNEVVGFHIHPRLPWRA